MYDPIEITKLLVFGTANPSSDDYNQHIRPTDATPASITYNMLEYMTTGGIPYFLDIANDPFLLMQFLTLL